MQNDEKNNEVDDNTFAKEALQCEIGNKLKQTREEKNISIEYVIKELKFSKTFLNALEDGTWENLPGEVYAIGFLKQYSALLDLDVSAEIDRIKSKSFELKAPETYPDVPISPNKKWVYIAIALFIALLFIVNISSTDDKEQSNRATNTTQTQTDTVTLTESTEPENIVVASDSYAENHVEPSALLAEESKPDAPIPVKKTYSFFAATNDVWLQVSEIDEFGEPQLLREVLLKKGQSFSIIDTASKLVLTAGNARALEVLEGNHVLFAAGTLGEENKVLKRFPINP